jgi:hypothetical protein
MFKKKAIFRILFRILRVHMDLDPDPTTMKYTSKPVRFFSTFKECFCTYQALFYNI